MSREGKENKENTWVRVKRDGWRAKEEKG